MPSRRRLGQPWPVGPWSAGRRPVLHAPQPDAPALEHLQLFRRSSSLARVLQQAPGLLVLCGLSVAQVVIRVLPRSCASVQVSHPHSAKPSSPDPLRFGCTVGRLPNVASPALSSITAFHSHCSLATTVAVGELQPPHCPDAVGDAEKAPHSGSKAATISSTIRCSKAIAAARPAPARWAASSEAGQRRDALVTRER